MTKNSPLHVLEHLQLQLLEDQTQALPSICGQRLTDVDLFSTEAQLEAAVRDAPALLTHGFMVLLWFVTVRVVDEALVSSKRGQMLPASLVSSGLTARITRPSRPSC